MAKPSQELDIAAAAATATANQENALVESLDFNLLHLDSTPLNPTTRCHTPCRSCGCYRPSSLPMATRKTTTINNNNTFSSSNKRRSPNLCFRPPKDLQLSKKPKKLFSDAQTHETTPTSVPSLHGFSKISLPSPLGFGASTSNNNPTSPPLRRSLSDPVTLSGSGTVQTPLSPPQTVQMAITPPIMATPSASLPPKPPSLIRTSSDPSPINCLPSTSNASDHAPDSNNSYKLLKRMRDSMNELNQWWDRILPIQDQVGGEEYEEDKRSEDINADDEGCEDINTEDEDEGSEDIDEAKLKEHEGPEDSGSTQLADLVTDLNEAMCVERTGECLTIKFMCPCKKGYKILLSGKDCYYKLL